MPKKNETLDYIMKNLKNILLINLFIILILVVLIIGVIFVLKPISEQPQASSFGAMVFAFIFSLVILIMIFIHLSSKYLKLRR